MTTTMSDLSDDLVSEILSRVPITSLASVRSTCKKWNALSRNRIFGKAAEGKNQFMGFLMKDLRIFSVKIDLQGICNDGDDSTDVLIKEVSVLNQIEVYKVHQCDGLLLFALTNTSRLLVWNPYLGQTRWIPHLFGSRDSFCLGYDNSGNHKILQLLDYYRKDPVFGFKIHEFSSNSWRDLDVTCNWNISADPVTLKGNAYFYAKEDIIVEGAVKREHFLLCFDFTSERFELRLSLPFQYSIDDTVTLSCVREEKLAVLYQGSTRHGIMEIWLTTKIDHNEVLWTKWMEMDMNLLNGFPFHTCLGSFFIDEENKVAVVFQLGRNQRDEKNFYQKAHIIGQDGYFKSIYVPADPYQVEDNLFMFPPLCYSYVPSLVEI